MNIAETLRVAWLGITGNWLRTALTMLGVIIGVSAVITLVSVGEGTRRQVTGQLEGLGSNLIMVTPTGGQRLELADAEAIAAGSRFISQAVPSVTRRTQVKYATEVYTTTVEGVSAGYPEVRSFPVARGRFIADDDTAARRRVAVVGQTVADELFAGDDPLGQRLRIDGQAFTVVGVMTTKGATLGQDNDDRIFIPVTTAQRIWGSTRLNMLYLQASGSADAAMAVADVRAFLERADIAARVQSQDEILATIGDVTGALTLMLGAIAGVSLLVGGIGIMNIMLVSVSERTREIGIRKAIGARRRDVLAQFLVEAVLVSSSGGLLGVALGTAGAFALRRGIGLQTLVSWQSVAISFAFAAAVGIFFGLYPAMRAARLDPIEALRRE